MKKTKARGAWLSEIGLAYAHNYNEIHAATARFKSDESTIRNQLSAHLKTAAEQAGLKVQRELEEWKVWSTRFISGSYEAARVEVGGKKSTEQSGISFALAPAEPGRPFGFNVYLFFLRSGSFKPHRPRIEALANAVCPDNVPPEQRVLESEGRLWISIAFIPPGAPEFDARGATEALDRAVEAFRVADDLLGKLYVRAKAG